MNATTDLHSIIVMSDRLGSGGGRDSGDPHHCWRRSQQHHHHGAEQAAMDVGKLCVERDSLARQLNQLTLLSRSQTALLRTSLTTKIRKRDAIITEMFDALAAASEAGVASDVVEKLTQRYARLARNTTGMDDDLRVRSGMIPEEADDDEDEEDESRGGKATTLTREKEEQEAEKARYQEENARLAQLAEAQQREIAQLKAELAAARRTEDRTGAARLGGLQRLAASCAALGEDVGAARRLARDELQAGMAALLREAEARLVAHLGDAQSQSAQLRQLYRAELAERRRLFNLVQELRGNIRVLVRPRPLTEEERQLGEERGGGGGVCMGLSLEANEVSLAYNRKHKAWEFDRVFGFEASQEEVYQEVSPLVQSVLDGYNVCLIAYGQTGAGKTYTMTGVEGGSEDPRAHGVNTRALRELFGRGAQRRREQGIVDAVSVSMVEIYLDSIQDLLSADDREAGAATAAPAGKRWEIKQGPQGLYVTDLTVVEVASVEEVLALMERGARQRAKAATNMNEHSSRSHLIVSVYVRSVNQGTGLATRGKLHLVDLAGSERVGKSGAEGQALKEAQSINKSLSALGDVIAARVNGAGHVPYRNSQLTYMLQDSLAGESKVAMFICVSPAASHAQESSCSLQFGARARKVEMGKATRQVEGGGPKASAGASAGLDASGSSHSDARPTARRGSFR